MPLSLKRFSLKAPPPRVVLLPDSLFFARLVPIGETLTEAEVVSQIELALEGLAPFPLAQMFYGYRWVPGAKQALVYACYRKRFTAEQTETWTDADAVLPRFAALLSTRVEPATTLVISSDDGVTAVHWGENTGVPTAVVSRAWLPDTGEIERRRLRDEIVRGFGGTRATKEVPNEVQATRDGGSSDVIFQAGETTSIFSREQLDALDVRDKTELSERRRARVRDLFLWRALLTCLAGLVLAAIIDLSLIGGRYWELTRQHQVRRQTPVVDDIMRLQELARRIQELSTNRLRPFEMIELARSKEPDSVTFLRATTNGVYKLEVEAYTSMAADVGVWQSGLRTLPQLEQVDIVNPVNRDGVESFRLVLTFRPNAFH